MNFPEYPRSVLRVHVVVALPDSQAQHLLLDMAKKAAVGRASKAWIETLTQRLQLFKDFGNW